MKNSNFKPDDPSNRPTYYSSEEDPRQTSVNDRIAQKAKFGKGADHRAASHAFKEAARRMVGQGNLQNILSAVELSLPELADLVNVPRKALAAIISGKGHVDTEMEEAVSHLETFISDTIDWFWTDPRTLSPEDVQRFNARFRPAEFPPSVASPVSTEPSTATESFAQDTDVAPDLSGETSPSVMPEAESTRERLSLGQSQGSLFSETTQAGKPVTSSAPGAQPTSAHASTQWASVEARNSPSPFFSGSAGAQVIRRKHRGSKEGAIAAENLRQLLARLEIDAAWLADRIGASAKGLKLVLSGKGAGDEEALLAVQYLEYPLRGKRGWFWTEVYSPTSEDIERFNARYTAHLFQEVPGSPVRRNAADVSLSFEPTRSANVESAAANPPSTSETPENPATSETLAEETSPGLGEDNSEALAAEESSDMEASSHTVETEQVSEPELSGKTGGDAAPEAQANVEAQSAQADDKGTSPPAFFIVEDEEVASRVSRPAPEKPARKSAKSKAVAAEHKPLAAQAEVASQHTEALPDEERLRLQTVLGNLSRLSIALDLGRDDFQRVTGVLYEMMVQLRQGEYSPEAQHAIRRLEEGLFLMAHEFEETHVDPSALALDGFEHRMHELLSEVVSRPVQTRQRKVVRSAPSKPKEVLPPPAVEAPAPAKTVPMHRGRPATAHKGMSRLELTSKNLESLCGGPGRRFGVRAVTSIAADRMDALLAKTAPAELTPDEEALIEQAFFLEEGWFTEKKQKPMPKAEFQARLEARIKGRVYP